MQQPVRHFTLYYHKFCYLGNRNSARKEELICRAIAALTSNVCRIGMINHAQFYQKTFLACKHFFIYICIILLIYAPWSLGRKDGVLNLSVLVLYQVCVYALVHALLAVRSPQSAVRSPQSYFILAFWYWPIGADKSPSLEVCKYPRIFVTETVTSFSLKGNLVPRVLSYRNRSNDVAGKTGFQCCLCYGRFHVVCIRNLLSLIYEGKRV